MGLMGFYGDSMGFEGGFNGTLCDFILYDILYIPSGNLLQFAMEDGPVKMVDLLIDSMVIFHKSVC